MNRNGGAGVRWIWCALAALGASTIGIAMGLGAGSVRRSAAPEPGVAAPAVAVCSLVVDYGDFCQKHYTHIEFKPGMTAFDILKAAEAHPRGVKVSSAGSGERAFVKAIDDVANGEKKARKADAKSGNAEPIKGYWQFMVNGKYGERGAGATAVGAGDEVRWFFGEYTPPAEKPASP